MIEGAILHYKILEKLGEGGMGEVYKAQDTKLDRFVALKFLPSQMTASEAEKTRFIQEAKTASAMNHPNVCRIYDIQELDGQLFIVMEYIDGKTLKDKLTNLSDKQKLEIGIQVAEGLAAAHEKGIVHRDIKPENIMIRKDGIVQIMDFGLAKLYTSSNVSRLTKAGTTMGTMGYMSPEQVQGLDVDHRTDIFSLGIVLYEMFAGESPFKGIHETAVMYEIVNVDPPPVSTIKEGVDAELDEIILECLEKDKDDRYQSAKELAKDLRKIKKSSGHRQSRVYNVETKSLKPQPVTENISEKSGGFSVELLNHRYDLTKIFKVKYIPWFLSLILLLILIYVLFSTRNVKTDKFFKFEQITEQSGEELFPDISPDGSFITYTKTVNDHQDIFLQRIGGGNAIDLTKDSETNNSQSSFSPDGNLIVFHSERDGGGIFIMGSTGESVRRLTNFGYNPAWSPDGTLVLFAIEPIQHPYSRGTISQLWTVDVSTGKTQKIYNGDAVQPCWSPDGKWVAFWGLPQGTGKRIIYILPSTGGNPIMITNDEFINWSPTFSPDGSYIYFSSNRGGSMNLWKVKIDKQTGKVLTDPEPATTPSSFCEMMKFSHDGKKIVFVSAEIRDNIYKLNFDPITEKIVGSPVPITEGTKQFSYPAISPDNKWIAATSTGQQEDIYIMRTDGSAISKLTNDIYKDRGPQWSPDGKSLAFYSDRTGKYEIWKINIDGSNLRQLTNSSNTMVTPYWFSDGNTILCNYANNSTVFFKPDSDTLKNFDFLPEYPVKGTEFYATSASPDGKYISGFQANLSNIKNEGIVIYSINSKSYQKLTDSGTGPNWFNDSKRILYSIDNRFYVLSIETKKSHPANDIPINLIDAWVYVLSPDSKSIYFINEEKESDIWLGSFENN
jgi:serine/threonine protein kinase